MNFGLHGIGMQESLSDLVAMPLEPGKALTSNLVNGWTNPFRGPCLVQPIVRFKSVGANFRKGDLLYLGKNFVANSGGAGSGMAIADCAQNIKIQNGTVFNTYAYDGSVATDILGAAYAEMTAFAIGRRDKLPYGIGIEGLRRYQTRRQLLTFPLAYQIPNPSGRIPKAISTVLVNRIAEAGYQPGDEYALDSDSGQTASAYCFAVAVNSLVPKTIDVYVSAPYVLNKASAGETALTSGRWDMYFNILA